MIKFSDKEIESLGTYEKKRFDLCLEKYVSGNNIGRERMSADGEHSNIQILHSLEFLNGFH